MPWSPAVLRAHASCAGADRSQAQHCATAVYGRGNAPPSTQAHRRRRTWWRLRRASWRPASKHRGEATGGPGGGSTSRMRPSWCSSSTAASAPSGALLAAAPAEEGWQLSTHYNPNLSHDARAGQSCRP